MSVYFSAENCVQKLNFFVSVFPCRDLRAEIEIFFSVFQCRELLAGNCFFLCVIVFQSRELLAGNWSFYVIVFQCRDLRTEINFFVSVFQCRDLLAGRKFTVLCQCFR